MPPRERVAAGEDPGGQAGRLEHVDHRLDRLAARHRCCGRTSTTTARTSSPANRAPSASRVATDPVDRVVRNQHHARRGVLEPHRLAGPCPRRHARIDGQVQPVRARPRVVVGHRDRLDGLARPAVLAGQRELDRAVGGRDPGPAQQLRRHQVARQEQAHGRRVVAGHERFERRDGLVHGHARHVGHAAPDEVLVRRQRLDDVRAV